MSDNLYKSKTLPSSSSPSLIDFKNINQKPNHRRAQSVFYTQESTLKDRLNINRRHTTESLYDKSSTTLFWDLVGRENYTISLNNSPVLCNSFSPPEEEYFSFTTSFVNKFGSFSWRSKSSSSRTVPTMVPKNDDSSINLLTTKFKGLQSKKVPASITSIFVGNLDKNTNINNTPSETRDEEITVPEPKKILMAPIELRGRNSDTEPVLSIDMAEQIRQLLPRRVRLFPTWNLLYSLDQDGTSMTTMYFKVKDKGPLIVAVKDMNEQVFGAFVSESLKPRPSYYGTGECFLWKHIRPKEKDTFLPKINSYSWTGRNEYMILSEHDYLAIGGGDGRVGLWMDSDLERGSSARCDTFENEILSSTPEFECMGFEVWGFN
ncbi:17307_t:CDS:2 [Funneliformis geosporum]|uniref:Oxidation resistance protein 1 n=1 Tax=Funneliformis geosporum TaxID=1117311 RepID=A0A9W4SNK8_9GLOM|nr:17307_t:CDS:2 [Funneliformis geosporum]CAI2175165.1 17041_t:CDS:2 [Funneliformis geosporum]